MDELDAIYRAIVFGRTEAPYKGNRLDGLQTVIGQLNHIYSSARLGK